MTNKQTSKLNFNVTLNAHLLICDSSPQPYFGWYVSGDTIEINWAIVRKRGKHFSCWISLTNNGLMCQRRFNEKFRFPFEFSSEISRFSFQISKKNNTWGKEKAKDGRLFLASFLSCNLNVFIVAAGYYRMGISIL